MTSKRLFIKTYGCQMNVYDSVRMQDVMRPLGYAVSETFEDADLVVLNTCHIREKAEEKVYSELGRIRLEKERKAQAGEKMLIAVGGCVGQAEGEEIIKRAPFVDIVLGPQSYHELPEMVTRALRGAGKVVELDFAAVAKFDQLPEPGDNQGASAFLAVQEGCDKFCTFCVVPYTRGAEYSRSVREIEEEAKKLVGSGALELTLLGQNVNAYHGQDETGKPANFATPIERLARIDGLRRIRYTTSHPRDMDEELIAIHGSEEKLMPYLHLPVQSGSDNILKQMNRKHTAEFYLDIIARLRKSRPDMAFSSDFIVGFPGETESDFNDTLSLVQQVGYASCFSFKYSPRPGTPAASSDQQVAEEIKTERLHRLQALLQAQQLAFNQSCTGLELDILFEKAGKREGQLIGKSPYLQSVHVTDARVRVGEIHRVRVTGAFQNSLSGELADAQTSLKLAV